MLRSRPVVLKNAATIPKFHFFVFGDAAARVPHILTLVINVAHDEIQPDPECNERAIEALVAILRHSPSLKSLELTSSANGRPLGYLDDARLSVAVGKVASLRALTIGGRTEVTDFIGAVHSPLTKLSLHFLNPVGGLDQWSPTDLNAALSRFAHSLETLSIEWSHVRLASRSLPGPSVHTLTQFHAVCSLTLNSLITVPHLPLLCGLFPNLDGTVHLNQFIYEIPYSVDQDDSERYNFLRRAREENGATQEGLRCWTHLERLICDVETLFVLNLRCPIGLTIVHGCRADDADSVARRYLVESLRDHPPTHLNLQVAANWNGGFDEPSLDGMISPEAAATLTHLTLCVKYTYDACSDPMVRFILPASVEMRWNNLWRNTLFPVIEPLRALTHFRLVFHCDAREAEVPARPIAEEPLVEDLRPTSRFGRFNFATVVSMIADALPSLQYCFVTNSAWAVETKLVYAYSVVERWRESHAWWVAHAPTGSNDVDNRKPGATTAVDTASGTRRELVELPDSIAETIIEEEDLVLSTEEKASVLKHNSIGVALG
ncbi:hypothetical protein V8D89_000223 [Ganoderma adspersum]